MKMTYETSRLLLEVLHSDAAEKILDFYNQNREFLEPWEPDRVPLFYTLPFQRTQLTFEYNQIIHGQTLRLWIMRKEDPEQIIGCISFNHIIRGSFLSCIAGYKIGESYCRQGYCCEALTKGLEIMFNEYSIHRIEAYVMSSNIPSIRLLEKLNFMPEGTAYSSVKLKGIWTDHLRFARIAD